MQKKEVVLIYGDAFFNQAVLTDEGTGVCRVVLDREECGLAESMPLHFVYHGDVWYFCWKSDMTDGMPMEESRVYCISLSEDTRIEVIYIRQDKLLLPLLPIALTQEQQITIGAGKDNILSYQACDLISARHAVIGREKDECYLVDTGVKGVYVNGVRVRQRVRLAFGDCVEIFGLQIICLNHYLVFFCRLGCLVQSRQLSPCRISFDRDSLLPHQREQIVHRAPRIWQPLITEDILIARPSSSGLSERQTGSWFILQSVLTALPMLVIGSFYAFFAPAKENKSPQFVYTGLLMSVISVAVGLTLHLLKVRSAGSQRSIMLRREMRQYQEYLLTMELRLKEIYLENKRRLLERYPAVAQYQIQAWQNSALWSRDERQEDFLNHRVGLGRQESPGNLKFEAKLSDLPLGLLTETYKEIKQKYEYLKEVPICLNLLENDTVGIAGEQAPEVMLSLLMQIALHNCYRDVKIVMLHNKQEHLLSKIAQVIKWLPHMWNERKTLRYLADNESQKAAVIAELQHRFQQQTAQNAAGQKGSTPHYLIITEGQVCQEDAFLMTGIKARTAELTFLFISRDIAGLPHFCNCFLISDKAHGHLRLRGKNGYAASSLQVDVLSVTAAEQLARHLAGFRVPQAEQGSDIPEAISFLALYGSTKVAELAIEANWGRCKAFESLAVPVGVKAGGELCSLDVHESCHGPHGLIAGTTGAGKSELLQTYLLSLAVNFSPEDILFFIIDYKGGGMGNLFSPLPHMAGIISNLSEQQVYRAMISIKSENKRRQKVLQEYGVNHIDRYTRLYKAGEIKEPMPHLFLIVDEFAQLKKEEPEFIRELISVAQVGRSLGIHLILATQKPAGTVDDNIWSNTRFRLCLRVQDIQDSMDMLHKPDAAFLNGSGRCCLQVGNDERYELFQSAYSGADYEKEHQEDDCVYLIDNTGKAVGGRRREEGGMVRKATQLESVVSYISRLGRQLCVRKGTPFWMPLLPELLGTLDLDPPAKEYDIPVGLCDDPERQRQYTMALNPASHGHLAIYGSAGSGKSTFLQTLFYQMCIHYPPAELHLYFIDYSSQALSAFQEMPHVGGVAVTGEPEKERRILFRIAEQLAHRKKMFAGAEFWQYRQKRVVPVIVLAIDHYAAFYAGGEGKYENLILQLAKEGSAYGIYLVLTGNGVGLQEIPFKIHENVKTTLVLAVHDRLQYGELLRMHHPPVIPAQGIRGRGLMNEAMRALEFQTALILGEKDDSRRMEKIRQRAAELCVCHSEHAPKVPALTEPPVIEEMLREKAFREKIIEADRIPLGYDDESGRIYGINQELCYCFLISGQKKSGKTNVLKVIIQMLYLKKIPMIILDFANRLTGLGEQAGAKLLRSPAEACRWCEEMLEAWQQQRSCDQAAYTILIDDIAAMGQRQERAAEGYGKLEQLLAAMLKLGERQNICWFCAAEVSEEILFQPGSFYHSILDYHQGMHLGGRLHSQQLIDCHDIPYSRQMKHYRPGIALLTGCGEEGIRKVIIPLYDKKELYGEIVSGRGASGFGNPV